MRKIISTFLVGFGFFAPLMVGAYSDVGVLNPHYVAISVMTDEGVFSGNDDGTFKSENFVNRAESAKVLAKFLGLYIDENVGDSAFSDINGDEWFNKYVQASVEQGIINGNPDGTFAPARSVIRAEFVKMLLLGVEFNQDAWKDKQYFADVLLREWYTPFMNYAGRTGILEVDGGNNLYPGKEMTRGEVAETMYLLLVILRGEDADFLMSQTEKQIARIEPYVEANMYSAASRAAQLASKFMDQAVKAAPDNIEVLGKTQIAKSYESLLDATVILVDLQNRWSTAQASEASLAVYNAKKYANEAKEIDPAITDRADYLLWLAKEVEEQILEP